MNKTHIIEEAIRQFEYVANNIASHAHVLEDHIYPQPSTYLTTHFICMHVAGFKDVDFDTLTAVSGASALFAYSPNDFMPKYAHLHIKIDHRIAQAFGFEWEWLVPETANECYDLLTKSLDGNKPVKGTFYENILFTGYSEKYGKRKLYVLTDGADYFKKWINWYAFYDWFKEWGNMRIGRYTKRVKTLSKQEVAIRVLNDLVKWSTSPPAEVVREYPAAKFGLEGIEAYANDCNDMERFKDWRACHDINPQWITRRSTSVYLHNLAKENLFHENVNVHLRKGSDFYEKCFVNWKAFYRYLGHGAPKRNGKDRKVRSEATKKIMEALKHESQALLEIKEGIYKMEQ